MNKTLQKYGWLILFILSVVPLVLWFFEPSLSAKFSNASSSMRSMGDIAGLCGMAMFSLVMILSGRLKFFERFFRGINELYIAHHFFGALAFCLLLFHPLLLAYNYLLISSRAAALFLLPGASLARSFGTYGLLIMIITLVITFYTKLKYQIWRFTHKFLGVAFIFAFLHTFMIGSDVASNPAMKIYLFILGMAALATYFYRTIFGGLFVKSFDYKVTDIKLFPDKIWEIEFRPTGRDMKFAAGQFAFVKLKSAGLSKEAHPFSFSSAPGFPLKIAIKELGDYTNKVGGIKVGDSATMEGPFGALNFKNYSQKKQIWIAGGIGITPFLSMARGLTENDNDYKIDLYYSVKNKNCLAFKEEIEEISEKYRNLKVFLWLTEEQGFLTGDAVKTRTPDLKEREILVCGPGLMMSSLKEQFLEQGVGKKQIRTEEFQLY